MSVDRGDVIAIRTGQIMSGGKAADPNELILTIIAPDGSTITRTYPPDEDGPIIRESAGNYLSYLTLSEWGEWKWRWEGKGGVQYADKGSIYVGPDDFAEPTEGRFSWRATVEDVAALLPQRTKGEFGKDGEFNNDTTPTRNQVERILTKAASRIASKLKITEDKDICADGPIDLATEMHALRAAMMVELTFFANQLRTDQSPYEKLKEQYDEGIKDLIEAYEDQCGGGETGLGGEQMPKGNFPRSKGWGKKRW